MASILAEGPVPHGKQAGFDRPCRPSAGARAACSRTGSHSLGIYAGLLALGLLLAGCSEATDSLNDLGRVRATFYKYHLAPEASRLDMPGARLTPTVACKEDKTPDGLFDPCKPDPDQPELDAYGLPRALPARNGRPTAQPTLPPTKPAIARPPSTKPAATKPARSAAKAAAVAKPAKKPLPPKKASKPKRQ